MENENIKEIFNEGELSGYSAERSGATDRLIVKKNDILLMDLNLSIAVTAASDLGIPTEKAYLWLWDLSKQILEEMTDEEKPVKIVIDSGDVLNGKLNTSWRELIKEK
ncbi:hypothetical protein [Oceanobacillus oncorhynchi]|uniref:hypothetical protein n=1 Tax=Oceanobacillus oncorhynchi TaxID=545501 RepID=UPI0018660496|nr:hypothetical protein [Oceanobacillus oncorhynchi]